MPQAQIRNTEMQDKLDAILRSICHQMTPEILAALEHNRTGQTNFVLFWQNGHAQTIKITHERTHKISG